MRLLCRRQGGITNAWRSEPDGIAECRTAAIMAYPLLLVIGLYVCCALLVYVCVCFIFVLACPLFRACMMRALVYEGNALSPGMHGSNSFIAYGNFTLK